MTIYKIWPPDGITCITNKFAHQLHALPDCLGLPYWHYQLVLSWYLHQPESHQLSLQNLSDVCSDNRTHRSDQGYLGPIKITLLGTFLYNQHFDIKSMHVNEFFPPKPPLFHNLWWWEYVRTINAVKAHIVQLSKGRHQNKKHVSIRALPEFGGGFTLARIFLTLFWPINSP